MADKIDFSKAKILSISAKCSDLCFAELQDANGDLVGFEQDGYVPEKVGIGGGDYVELDIDLATGQIVGWKPPSEAALKKAFGKKAE